MNAVKTLAVGLAVLFALALAVRAEDKKSDAKEVTLKGTIICTRCGLGEKIPDCQNAIQVKDGDKTVVYYIKDEGKAAPYHPSICTASKKGSVTGVVSTDKDKNFITPSKDGVVLSPN